MNLIPTVCFDSKWRAVEEIVAIAEKTAAASLSPAPEFRTAIARGADFVDRRLAEDGAIYGVTTGFGDSCTVMIEAGLIAELPRHLYTFHGCGLGAHFTPSETRAVIATRLTSLCKGFSGVGMELLEQLVNLLKYDILPAIPCEGSVGAASKRSLRSPKSQPRCACLRRRSFAPRLRAAPISSTAGSLKKG